MGGGAPTDARAAAAGGVSRSPRGGGAGAPLCSIPEDAAPAAPEAGAGAGAPGAVGCTLLLALALQEAGSQYAALIGPGACRR